MNSELEIAILQHILLRKKAEIENNGVNLTWKSATLWKSITNDYNRQEGITKRLDWLELIQKAKTIDYCNCNPGRFKINTIINMFIFKSISEFDFQDIPVAFLWYLLDFKYLIYFQIYFQNKCICVVPDFPEFDFQGYTCRISLGTVSSSSQRNDDPLLFLKTEITTQLNRLFNQKKLRGPSEQAQMEVDDLMKSTAAWGVELAGSASTSNINSAAAAEMTAHAFFAADDNTKVLMTNFLRQKHNCM